MDLDSLYDAAIAGDTDAVAVLEMKADRLTEENETILHIESQKGKTEHVRFILRKFASKNLLVKLDNQKETALTWAAYFGHTEVAEVLIDAAKQYLPPPSSSGDNPIPFFQAFLRHADKDMDTALHIAVINNRVETVKLLAEADPTERHRQNNEGKTPIYIAAENGYTDIVKVICTSCTAPSLDGPGDSTALHAAILNIYEENEEDRYVIRMIIDTAKKRSSHFEAFFNRIDEDGCTVLQLAVSGNHVNAVEHILQEDPAYKDDRGIKRHHLMNLIYESIDMGYNKDIIKLLSLTYEAGINPLHKGVLALIINIKKRKKESILHLLGDNKHMASFVDDQGWTVLHYAVYHEFDSILKPIIDAQRQVGYQLGDTVPTPFHVAFEHGYISTLILLMQLWPDSSSAYTSVDKDGRNILHLAVIQNKEDMVRAIIKYCPQMYKDKMLNEQDMNGNTPLHLLVSNYRNINPEIIPYEGFDVTVKNKKNLSPLDMLSAEDANIAQQGTTRKTGKTKRRRRHKLVQIGNGDEGESNWSADAVAGDAISKSALEMKADTLNESGQTILHVESMKGDTERVGYILREFANKNLLAKLDNQKQTALHLAAHNGHIHVVEVLIHAARHLPVSSFQAFIRQATGPMGNTALHLAVKNGNVAIVELLVEADPDDSHVQNFEGKTPIYIAAEEGYKNIIKVMCTTCTALSLQGPGGSTTVLHALIKNIEQGM